MIAQAATTIPKDTTGVSEALRVLTIARSSAVKARTIAVQQARDLLVTAPDDIRARAQGTTLRARLKKFEKVHPDTTRLAEPGHAIVYALETLARRVRDLDTEISDLDTHIDKLTAEHAPTLRSLKQVGPHTTAQLLITAGGLDNRIGSEAALARLTGIAPIPVSSGKTHRHRLHRGGDRQANRAIHMIAVGRLRSDPKTRTYAQRRTQDGLSKQDTIRCLKRYICREIYQALKTDLNWT
ncbi:MAG: IS110 family transposase [Aeromicrobium sp.]|uniref:IS110 family transposase n=1 Tax=Aeromicrobium sp. TaxID=1871063 RepID=UPI0039E67D27